MIRLAVPSVDQEDVTAVGEVLLTGNLVQGRKVAEFEARVAQCVGTRYAVAVSNCTAALHVALLALGVGPGDIVVVTSYSWISTANVIELCGAQPVFTDIDPGTLNMSPESLAKTLERLMDVQATAVRVKAILPVHTFGLMADMPAILEIAARYGIPVLEDAACAFGSAIGERRAGAWGIAGCFSFHPRKAITTGEGGIITTDSVEIAWKLRALRNHGISPDGPPVNFVMPGFNYRLTEFQAALGMTQLNKLERIIGARKSAAERYTQMLGEIGFEPQKTFPGYVHVYQSYIALAPAGVSLNARQIVEKLAQTGIEASIGTWHMPLTSYFRSKYGYAPGDFPATDQVFIRALSLPIYENIETETQGVVARALSAICSSKSNGVTAG